MRVAVLSESPADEAAVRILVNGLLGAETEPIPGLRARGWPSVCQVLPTVLKHLHYQTDAEALVVVADSNHTLVHQSSHDQPGAVAPNCRLCELRALVEQTLKHLRPQPARIPIKIGLGLAVPAIEAWYLCGAELNTSERVWAQGLASGSVPYSKNRLKQAVYGTDRPPLSLETKRATEEAHRLVKNLPQLEQRFPGGFGALARDVRSWQPK